MALCRTPASSGSSPRTSRTPLCSQLGNPTGDMAPQLGCSRDACKPRQRQRFLGAGPSLRLRTRSNLPLPLPGAGAGLQPASSQNAYKPQLYQNNPPHCMPTSAPGERSNPRAATPSAHDLKVPGEQREEGGLRTTWPRTGRVCSCLRAPGSGAPGLTPHGQLVGGHWPIHPSDCPTVLPWLSHSPGCATVQTLANTSLWCRVLKATD